MYFLGDWSMAGSPPHRRGKVLDAVIEHAFDGITPAQAGKRILPSTSTPTSWDHPRIGGEKVKQNAVVGGGQGSPPRGRGKVCPAKHDERQPGITPA